MELLSKLQIGAQLAFVDLEEHGVGGKIIALGQDQVVILTKRGERLTFSTSDSGETWDTSDFEGTAKWYAWIVEPPAIH